MNKRKAYSLVLSTLLLVVLIAAARSGSKGQTEIHYLEIFPSVGKNSLPAQSSKVATLSPKILDALIFANGTLDGSGFGGRLYSGPSTDIMSWWQGCEATSMTGNRFDCIRRYNYGSFTLTGAADLESVHVWLGGFDNWGLPSEPFLQLEVYLGDATSSSTPNALLATSNSSIVPDSWPWGTERTFTFAAPLRLSRGTPYTFRLLLPSGMRGTLGASNAFSLFGSELSVPSSTVVISQAYGGGGGTGTYLHDYVELKNVSGTTQSLNGLSLAYGASTGNLGNVIQLFALPNVALGPGQYFLVQTSGPGSSGDPFPGTPDAITNGLTMSLASGKVALVTSGFVGGSCGSTANPCPLPNSNIVDLVAWGASNNAEGGAPTNGGVALDNTKGNVRNNGGCADTDNNDNDFAIHSPPIPRNSATTPAPCGSSGGFTGIVAPLSGTTGVTQFRISGTATANGTVRCTETFPDGTTAVWNYSVNSSGSYDSGLFTLSQIGPHNCRLRDLASGQERNVTYTGNGDFSAVINSPSNPMILRGNAASYSVTFTSLSGFAGVIKPAALNWDLVPGTNASWNPQTVSVPVGGSATSVFTLQTSSATPANTYGNIVLLGRNGSATRAAATVGLSVTASYAAPSIAPPISPSSVPFNQDSVLTINGSNFRPNFNAIVGGHQIAGAGLTYVSSSQVKVQVKMLGAPPYDSTVRIINEDGKSSNAATFSVAGTAAPAPGISDIIPNPSPLAVNQEELLTVTGSNFVNKPTVQVVAPNQLTVDIAPSAVTFVNSNQIRVRVNMTGTPPYQATLMVKNPDHQIATRLFPVGGNASSLELYGLEITQSLQDLSNGVVLVQDKRTFVRAHVRSNSGYTKNVSAKLIGRRNGIALPGSPLRPINYVGGGVTSGSIDVKPTGPLLSAPWRTELNDSFLFELPSTWRTGSIDIEFQGVSNTFLCREDNGSSGDCHLQRTFEQVPSPEVRLVGIIWGDNGVNREPTSADMEKAAQQIESQFPIPRLSRDNPYNVDSFLNHPPSSTADWVYINADLAGQRILDGCVSPLCNRFYLGIVTNPSNAPVSQWVGMAQFIGGSVGSGYINNDFTVPHEFAHMNGRRHTGASGCRVPDGVDPNYVPADGSISDDKSIRGAWGFDIFNSNSLAGIYGPYTKDLMSYCDKRWISNYTYNGILASIRSRYSQAAEIKAKISSGTVKYLIEQNAPATVVSGTVELAQTAGSINTIYNVNSPTSAIAPPGGNYAIRFENNLGQTLASYPFSPDIPSDGNIGSFGLLLPADPLTAKVSLLLNGQPLSSRTASPTRPTVLLETPNGGEVLNGDSASIGWTSGDSDGELLKYTVQYSSDNGTTWQTVATDWPNTTYTLNLNSVSGSSQGRIRVLASDGFYTAEDQSDGAFTIVGHGPTVQIATPSPNSVFVGDQPVNFQGSAEDLEDGALSGTTLRWTSNLDGFLGDGGDLSTAASSLTEGNHILTLSAEDSEGKVGSAYITFQIVRSRPVIPPSLSLTPSSLSLASRPGGQSNSQIVAVRNDGDGTINWTANANQNWINFATASGASPANISITANAAGMSSGIYNANVTVTTADAPNSPQVIPISLFVDANADVILSGRVMGSEGRGIRGAIVRITDPEGITRTVPTDSYGFFRFENVATGKTYTLSVSQRRYVFTPQTITVTDTVVDINFIGTRAS